MPILREARCVNYALVGEFSTQIVLRRDLWLCEGIRQKNEFNTFQDLVSN